jgi:hypothetical protein
MRLRCWLCVCVSVYSPIVARQRLGKIHLSLLGNGLVKIPISLLGNGSVKIPLPLLGNVLVETLRG